MCLCVDELNKWNSKKKPYLKQGKLFTDQKWKNVIKENKKNVIVPYVQ